MTSKTIRKHFGKIQNKDIYNFLKKELKKDKYKKGNATKLPEEALEELREKAMKRHGDT